MSEFIKQYGAFILGLLIGAMLKLQVLAHIDKPFRVFISIKSEDMK